MNRALFSALSSTLAQQTRIDVASNNLANVSTVGYKAGRVNFQDAYYQTLRPGTSGGDTIGTLLRRSPVRRRMTRCRLQIPRLMTF